MEFFRLLLGTVIHRPYVYAFFLCYLFFAVRHMGFKDTLIYLVATYLMAFGFEYSATHNGFPFGYYEYFDNTRAQELWIANVPFWDSLSFVFLSYFSWCMACLVSSPRRPERVRFKFKTALLSGLLMMALDMVIDPIALLGDRWFLGRVYDYPHGGSYFGVTLSNFVGWFFAGVTMILCIHILNQWRVMGAVRWRPMGLFEKWGIWGVYTGVFLFNLSITAWVGPKDLLLASSAVTLVTVAPLYLALKSSFKQREV